MTIVFHAINSVVNDNFMSRSRKSYDYTQENCTRLLILISLIIHKIDGDFFELLSLPPNLNVEM